MSFVCNLCKNNFTQKVSLMRHLKEKRCKTGLLYDLVKLNKILNFVNMELLNINTNIEINTINELKTCYIKIDEMREIFDIYDMNRNMLNSLLSEYIKNIICNEKYPENHCIKYVDKKMKIFSLYITENGIKKHIRDNSKQVCHIASEYFYKIIKKQKCKFLEFYKHDDDFYHLYKDTIILFDKNLTKDNVNKALKTCLHAYILNDKNMKLIN
jgi:hypothetical protein